MNWNKRTHISAKQPEVHRAGEESHCKPKRIDVHRLETLEAYMKKFLLISLFGIFALTGCVRHYTLTLNNGQQIGARGKPQLKNGMYEFKDALGQPAAIPFGRVREISPASQAKPQASPMVPQPR